MSLCSEVHKDRTMQLRKLGNLQNCRKKIWIVRHFWIMDSFVREEVEALALKTRPGKALQYVENNRKLARRPPGYSNESFPPLPSMH